MLDEVLNTIADVEIIVTFFSIIVFVASYGTFFAWKKTPAGRAVFYVFASMALLSLISLLAVWVGQDFWLRPAARAVVWFLIPLSIINLIVTLWANYRRRQPTLNLEPKHRREFS
jgi:predicted membrane channel-forming protein YqfA (hemolysin III family)